MNENGSPSITVIVIIVVSILVGAGLIGFLLFKFVFQKNSLKRQIRDLDRRFQYLHALLIGQDAQYVKRLEIISRTNLLYVDIHTKFLKTFKEIRDKQDANTQSVINRLADMLADHHYKQAKAYFPEVQEFVKDYETAVSNLNAELLKVVKPEEDCRQASLALKEQFRRIKQDYLAKQGDLLMLSVSFEKVFKLIDEKFEIFENFVESAQYDEANGVLPDISNILSELSKAMIDLPNLCVLVSDVLPTKLGELEKAYYEMNSNEYPLHHLCIETALKEMRAQLEVYKTKLRQFSIHGVKDALDNMLTRIDEFFKKFEEEKEARKLFEEQNDEVYSKVNLIERRFIKLCNTIPEVSRIYIINDAHRSKVNEIQSDINKVGALKRSLDTFIHSNVKQPYSSLVEKMNELKEASDSIISELDEFNSYLHSLKSDSEEAYKLLFTFFDKLKRAEKEINDINISRLREKYTKDFDRSYELLNSINALLMKSPINVDEINKNVAELYEVCNNILDDGSIAQEHNMMTLAENAIMYANKGRSHLSDIDQLVSQAETFFKDGDFEQAYIIAGNALKKIRANNERQ